MWLGTLNNTASAALAVSADGSVVVGWSGPQSAVRAVRWTDSEGMLELGTLGGKESCALGVSANGSVIVGWTTTTHGQTRAFRWTPQTGMRALEMDIPSTWESTALAVSADGSTIVGALLDPSHRRHAFLWREPTGLVILVDAESSAQDVSSDGSVVVGWLTDAEGRRRAFRWTADQGLQILGTLGGHESVATAVSPDGTLVVGYSHNAYGQRRAFLWAEATGRMYNLGQLGGKLSTAYAVSSIEDVIVGSALNASRQQRAFYWTRATKMQDLSSLCSRALGVEVILLIAHAIALNRQYIVGQGINPRTRRPEAFRLHRETITPVLQSVLEQPQPMVSRVVELRTQQPPSPRVSVRAPASARKASPDISRVRPSAPPRPQLRPSLRWLGTLGGKESRAIAIAANGAIIGWALTRGGFQRAVLWTPTGDIHELPTPGASESAACGISSDGNLIVGWVRDRDNVPHAAYWDLRNGMSDPIILCEQPSEAQGIAPHGTIIIGKVERSAAQWIASGQAYELAVLSTVTSQALAVADRNATIVGWCHTADENPCACFWDSSGGPSMLESMGGNWSMALAISADGNTIVGWAFTPQKRRRAVRWTAIRGGEELELPQGYLSSEARAISVDGSIIVGTVENALGYQRAVRWTAEGVEILSERYASLLKDGSVLLQALGLSPDGRYIVGTGLNTATGCMEAFVLDTGAAPSQ